MSALAHTVQEALERFELVQGMGDEDTGTACAMTALSWMAGEEWTDTPPCVHPLISQLVVSANERCGRPQRAELVRLGACGALHTAHIPDPVVVWAMRRTAPTAPVGAFAYARRTLQRIAAYKRDHQAPPDLRGADLECAPLAGARLWGAALDGGRLGGAQLVMAELSGADLTGADLRGANLTGAHLRGAKLCGADLCRAQLYVSDLRGADLTGANLRGAYLEDSRMRYACLQDADLTDAQGRPADGMPAGYTLSPSKLWSRDA